MAPLLMAVATSPAAFGRAPLHLALFRMYFYSLVISVGPAMPREDTYTACKRQQQGHSQLSSYEGMGELGRRA